MNAKPVNKTTYTQPRRVFSYLRWSSEPQTWGDSERRQAAMADTWCEQHGVALTDNYRDSGVSAYRGLNRESQLGELLKEARRGDYVLVEDSDAQFAESNLKTRRPKNPYEQPQCLILSPSAYCLGSGQNKINGFTVGARQQFNRQHPRHRQRCPKPWDAGRANHRLPGRPNNLLGRKRVQLCVVCIHKPNVPSSRLLSGRDHQEMDLGTPV